MKARTLIVDDEPLARDRLRQLLQAEPEVELVGECADGAEAVASIRALTPDLVFLDVQMPELSGFQVLEQLQGGPMPLVIFVTAYDEYALRAFEVHAVDYLLKPFDRERFQKALQRALDQLKRSRVGELNDRLSALLKDLGLPGKYPERLVVKSGGRVVFVPVQDIDWIEAADNYVQLHVGAESHLHRQTMTELEQTLPPDKFLRISRSTIVNVTRIKEMQPLFHGEYAVILRDGTRLTLSRGYRDKLGQLLGRKD